MAEKDSKKLGDAVGKIAKAAKAASDVVGDVEKGVKKAKNGAKKTSVKTNSTVAKKSTDKSTTGGAKKKPTASRSDDKKESTAMDDYRNIGEGVFNDARNIGDTFFGSNKNSSDDNENNSQNSDVDIKDVFNVASGVAKNSKKRKATAKKAKKKLKKSSKIQIAIITIALVLVVAVFMVYVISPDTFYRGYDAIAALFLGDGYGDDFTIFGGDEGDLDVYFIDVGQGDSVLIKFPNNQTMLIDGGENRLFVENSIKVVMDKLNVKFIDYVMLTHTDSDHVGSLDYVVNNYEIGTFFIPDVVPSYKMPDKDNVEGSISTKAYYEFYTAASNEKYTANGETKTAEIKKNVGVFDILTLNTLKLTAYCPDEAFYNNITNKSSAFDKNNMSPICILEFAGRKICLTGDADEEAENRFMASAKQKIDVDVLKAGHHGSDTSTNEAFFDFVTPEHTAISVGEGNSYKHPKQSVLDRLSAAGNTIYRTDKDGTIKVSVSGDGVLSFDKAKAA